MLQFVILVIATTATFHNIKGESEAKYSFKDSQAFDTNIRSGERMAKLENQMQIFGNIIQEQGKKLEMAENEINNLKTTIQGQEAEMKLMEYKMDKYETVVNEQRERLNDKEKVIKDLERNLKQQGTELSRIINEIILVKGALEADDTKVKVWAETNGNMYGKNMNQEKKIGGTKNEENRKYDPTDNFTGSPEKEDAESITLETRFSTEMPYHQSEHTENPTNTFVTVKRQAGSAKDIDSLQHKKKRQIASGVAFSAYLSHVIDNMTIGYTIKCDQVLLNDGNVYSPYTGTFTVPETGVYLLTFSIAAATLSDRTHVKLVSNNRNIVDAIAYVRDSWHHVMGGNTAIVSLNSGEKVWLEIYDTAGVQLYSKTDYRWVTFSGFLLYS